MLRTRRRTAFAGLLAALTALAAGCSDSTGWDLTWRDARAAGAAEYVRLGEIRTNVRTPRLERRVEALIDVGLSETGFAAAQQRLGAQAPALRNAAILYFADQPPDELRGEPGRRRAAKALKARFNEVLGEPVVRAVRFEKLLID